MLTKIVNGEEVELSAEEETELRDKWADADLKQEQDKIVQAKKDQKELLTQQKIESLLVPEFTEIDAATTEAEIKNVTLKVVQTV